MGGWRDDLVGLLLVLLILLAYGIVGSIETGRLFP
jgi:hypothetical protein